MESVASWWKPELHSYFDESADWSRLGSILNRNVNGSTQVIRTPFFNKGNPANILSKWEQVVVKAGLAPELLDYELEAKDHVGPMSTQLPLTEMIPKIEEYFSKSQSEVELSAEAVARTVADYSTAKGISPSDYRTTALEMRKNTFSGSEYASTRGDVLDISVKYLERGGVLDDNNRCAVMLHRGQEGGPDVSDQKHRVVMGYAYEVNIAEGTVYGPMTKAFQANGLVPGWISQELVDETVTKLFDTGDPNSPIICTDFSAFDQHFSVGLQNSGLKIIDELVTPSPFYSYWREKIYPLAFTQPLLCSEELMVGPKPGKRRGMGSGSRATQNVETPTHRGLQHQAAIDQSTELNPFSQDVGDDSIMKGDDLDLTGVMETYNRFGLEMNPDKQNVALDFATYLRRAYLRDYRVNGVMVGIYPTFRALGRLLFQERFHDPSWWNAEMVTLAAWSVIENCKWHPLFEEFVDYVLEGDKYKLGMLIPGFMDRVDRLAHEAINREPDFLGYLRSVQGAEGGIRNWRICKYLESLSI